MKPKAETLPVIFRKFKDTGEVLAIFPATPVDPQGKYCESYGWYGHAACDYHGIIAATFPAQPHEYAQTLKDLQKIGYENIEVYTRSNRRHRERLLQELNTQHGIQVQVCVCAAQAQHTPHTLVGFGGVWWGK